MHAGFASPPIIERWECYHKNFKPVSDIAKPSQRAQIRIEHRSTTCNICANKLIIVGGCDRRARCRLRKSL